jgi:hypothetical protein
LTTRTALPVLRGLDPGIARYVEVLLAAGVHTFESCESGAGHVFPEPIVRFAGGLPEGFRALAVALEHGFPREVASPLLENQRRRADRARLGAGVLGQALALRREVFADFATPTIDTLTLDTVPGLDLLALVAFVVVVIDGGGFRFRCVERGAWGHDGLLSVVDSSPEARASKQLTSTESVGVRPDGSIPFERVLQASPPVVDSRRPGASPAFRFLRASRSLSERSFPRATERLVLASDGAA